MKTILIASSILVSVSLPRTISAADDDPLSTFVSSYNYRIAPADGATPSAFQPVGEANQSSLRVAPILNAALRAADRRRHDLSIQDARVFADAVRRTNLDPANVVRISEINRQIVTAERERAPAYQLAALRAAQVSAQRYHPNFTCSPGSPRVSETSVGGEYEPDAASFPKGTVRPLDVLSIYGCNFGGTAGTISVHLNTSNADLPLGLNANDPQAWSDNLITVDLYAATTFPDQPATVTVTDAKGNSASFSVSFVALRAVYEIQVNHGNVISVNHACAHAATHDECVGAALGNKRFPTGRTFVDVHEKVCCRSTNSTDVYYLKLTNGFTIPKLDPYVETLATNSVPDNAYDPGSGVLLLGSTGGTTCNFFGHNHAGHIKGVASGPSSVPGYTAQIAFLWHVDGHCSWTEFDGTINIVGPEDVQYW